MNVSIIDGVANVDFGRPEVANSLDEAAWQELKDTFERLDRDKSVKVILLLGEGKHFCAGMDLSVLGSLAQRITTGSTKAMVAIKTFIRHIQNCISAIESCRKPVIAAIQGGCIGGGLAIATACDFRYCTKGAYFVVKEIDFGIVADIGTLQRLPKLISYGLAAELCYTGRKMDGQEAAGCGLVNRLFEDREKMLMAAQRICSTIAQKESQVVEGLKNQLQFASENTISEGLAAVADYSAHLMAGKLQ